MSKKVLVPLVMTTESAISREVASSSISIHGGTGNADGAELTLYGSEHATLPGAFQIHAKNEETDAVLAGSVDGALTWNGSDVLTRNDNITVVDSYTDGVNWYRVWSDGFIEQGGRHELSSTVSNTTTFILTLHTAFSDTAFNMQFTGSGGADIWTGVAESTTTIKMTGYDRSTAGTVGGYLYWRASGY